MSSENQHSDFLNFRKYYNGDMSSDEKTVFEKNLENDPFAKDAYEGFLMYEKNFDKISAIEKSNMAFKAKAGIESGSKINLKPLLGIAASVVVLFSAFYVLQNGAFDNKTEVAENTNTEQEIIFEDKDVEEEVVLQEPMDSMTEGEEEIIEDETVVNFDALEENKSEKDFSNTQNRKEKFVNPAPSQNVGSNKKQINPEDFYNNNQQNQPEQGVVISTNEASSEVVSEDKSLYNSLYYDTDDNLNKESNAEPTLSDFKSGIVAYNQSNYNKAIQKFEASAKAKKSINSSNYYLGMSYFNLNKHSKAINAFDKVINTSSNFADDAMWYKSLSLISKGQKAKARQVLQSIIDMNSSFKNAAQNKLLTL